MNTLINYCYLQKLYIQKQKRIIFNGLTTRTTIFERVVDNERLFDVLIGAVGSEFVVDVSGDEQQELDEQARRDLVVVAVVVVVTVVVPVVVVEEVTAVVVVAAAVELVVGAVEFVVVVRR